MAQGPIIDVQNPGPGDGALVDVELIAVVQVVVDHRRQEVVGGGDGVEVAGQVQVHPLGRQDAGTPGAAGPSFDAEGGPHGRLAQGEDGLLSQTGEPLGQSDGRGGLALPERRRCDRSDDDIAGFAGTILCAGPLATRNQGAQIDLGHVATIGNNVLGSDTHRGRQRVKVNRGPRAVSGHNRLSHVASLVGRRESLSPLRAW